MTRVARSVDGRQIDDHTVVPLASQPGGGVVNGLKILTVDERPPQPQHGNVVEHLYGHAQRFWHWRLQPG
jgi:hypothetical protein